MAHSAKFEVIRQQRNPVREITPDDGLWVCAYNDDEESEEFGDETEIRIKGLTPAMLIKALWAEVGAGTINRRDMEMGGEVTGRALLAHLMSCYMTRANDAWTDGQGRQREGFGDALIEAYMLVHGIRDRDDAAKRLGEDLAELRANMN